MIYILETEIVASKPLKVALNAVYGLGKNNVHVMFKSLGFSTNLMLKHLSNAHLRKVFHYIEESNLVVASDLKNLQVFAFKSLVEIKAYKGLRKLSGLPSRGQRTHTNSKTAKRFKKF